jgi:peptidoglycan/LPS O-acetylase OafA/YrhL
MQPKPSSAVRFNALTGVRCIAVCMVFVYHNRKYWRPQLHPEFLRLINEFNIGVSIFFVLSGFLISYTYSDKPLQSFKTYSEYMLLRFARILPLYWLILTCYYLDPTFGKHAFNWQTYSLVHAFSDKHNLDGLSQAWSLNVEMVFYFFAPLLCLLEKKKLCLLIGFLLALFGLTWAIGVYWHHLNGNPNRYFYPVKFLLEASFPGRCTEFLAGILMARSFNSDEPDILKRIPHKTLIGFAGIFITAYCIGLFQPDIYHQGADNIIGRLIELFILPVFIAIVLMGLIEEKTWLQAFFGSRIMLLLGNASFAFYLVHISYINLKLKQYFLLPDRNFIVLWLIAIALYLAFEKPLYGLFRKWIKPSAAK